MRGRQRSVWIVCFILILSAFACNFPTPTPFTPTETLVLTTTAPVPASSNTPFVLATATSALKPTDVPPVENQGCTLNASYVADMTIPDDTRIKKGADFVKTWRIRNSGTCPWKVGTKFVHVSGEVMGAPASVAVPATASGAEVDISVEMAAPMQPGTYRSDWRLETAEGKRYGSTFYMRIVVEGDATATPTPTLTPTPTPTPTATPTSIVTVPPANLTGVVASDCVSVTLTWTDAVGEVSYRLQGPSLDVALKPDTTRYVWKNPPSGESTIMLTATAEDGTEIGRLSVTIEVVCVEDPAPDLVLESLSFDPDPPVAKRPLKVIIQVRNQGNAKSPNFVVRWWGNTAFTSPSCEWPISGSLGVGEAVTLECGDFQYDSTHDSIVTRVEADADNVVTERNKGNNVLERTISIVSQP